MDMTIILWMEHPLSKRRKVPNTKRKEKRWKWNDAMVENLIKCLIDHKTVKEYEGVDFESDLVTLYGEIRKMMGGIYTENHFGPVEIEMQNIEYMDVV